MAHHEPDIALSEPSADEIKTTTCYMCACRCGIRVHLKDGRVRYIDGNRDHPVNRGRDLRQGLRRHHDAHVAVAAARADEARRPARLRRVRGDHLGRGAGNRDRLAQGRARPRSEQARVLHRPRPEPGADRLVRPAIRHAELRRAWRLLLGQHGGGRALHVRRLVLGVRRAGLGAHQILHAVRRGRGSRLQPAQDRARQAQGKKASRSSPSIRSAPAMARSPTSGSASGPAPMDCSSAR